ncbi:MBL fold metallo-hydrolase [Rhodobacter sp.]
MLDHLILPVTAYAQNCTIFFDTETGEAAVIDPGGDVARILAALRGRGLRATGIWLTHGHVDHAGGAMDLRDALNGVPILGPHRADDWLLAGLEEKAAGLKMPGVRNCVPDRYLHDGEDLRLGSCHIRVRHVPGHSPGHVVFHAAEAGVMQVGDLITCDGPGRGDLPGSDPVALIAAIRDTLLPLPDDLFLICGHGPAGPLARARPWIEALAAEDAERQ